MKARQPKKPAGRIRQTPIIKRAPITTYYRSETDPTTASPFKKKAPKKNHRKLLLGSLDIILIVALFITVVHGLLLNDSPKIIASNSAFHSAADYQKATAAKFDAYKNRNKITFDEPSVAQQLRRQYPEISSVQVELPFFSQTATVRLAVGTPSFRLSSSSALYIVDSDGVVVTTASSLPQLKNLPLVTDQSGFTARIGQPVLSAPAVQFIDSVIAQCLRAKVPLSNLTLPAIPQEIDVRTSDQPYYTKFYLGGDPILQAGQFLAARNQFAQKHQSPSQYLDVRVSGKIFYK